MLNSIAIILIL